MAAYIPLWFTVALIAYFVLMGLLAWWLLKKVFEGEDNEQPKG